MAGFAHIVDGKVHEVIQVSPIGRYHPDLVWVAIPDDVPVEQRWLYDGTTFSPPPEDPGLTLSQQADLLLVSGVHLEFTSAPALNGTYSVDDLSRADVVAITTGLNAGFGFPPNEATTLPYPDMSGFYHIFDAENFLKMATAMRDFVWKCRAVRSGASDTLPSATVTIP